MTTPNPNPFEAIEHIIALSSRDMSLSNDTAALYAIVFGWEAATPDVARRHEWDEETVAKLQALHEAWAKAKRIHENPPLQLRPFTPADYRTLQGFDGDE